MLTDRQVLSLCKTFYLIRSVNNSDDYDKNYLKKKINSNDDLPLKERLDLYHIKVVVRSIVHEGNKYYSRVFLDECF